MSRLFGTDGVRGVANRDLTPDLALTLGRAAGLVLAPDGAEMVVGRDTRVSGPMLEGALVAGLCSAGVNVRLAGVIPAPALAFLTVDHVAQAGAVVSASHNPVADNGIKFFSDEGMKIPTEVEDEIEGHMLEPVKDLPVGTDVGSATVLEDAYERYVEHLVASVEQSLDGLDIVVDCAHGAGWRAAPEALRRSGARVVAINDDPDGARINVDCGSTSLDDVAHAVRAEGAHLGLALDGDGDRVLAVDEHGDAIDGDRIIGMLALRLFERHRLTNNVVVVTVMSNLGFRRALEHSGIDVVAAPVGDRFVAEAMVANGAVLGGEQSGHVIFGDYATTGDGILTGLQIAQAVASADAPLSGLATFFEPFPQVLINVPVSAKDGLEQAESLWADVARAEESLGGDGRVLVRPSGTEPVVRVMVEASDSSLGRTLAEDLARSVRRHLGP